MPCEAANANRIDEFLTVLSRMLYLKSQSGYIYPLLFFGRDFNVDFVHIASLCELLSTILASRFFVLDHFIISEMVFETAVEYAEHSV